MILSKDYILEVMINRLALEMFLLNEDINFNTYKKLTNILFREDNYLVR